MKSNAFLSSVGPEDTVVCFGSRPLQGQFEKLAKARKVLIFEPDPERAILLRHKSEQFSNISISAGAFLPGAQQLEFKRYNYEALDGFLPVEAYLQRFPGLREIETIMVPAVELDAFVAALPEEHRGRDFLLVDMIGKESIILEELADAGVLERVSDIVFHMLSDPLVADHPDGMALASRLRKDGFNRMIDLGGQAQPDFLLLWALRYPEQRKLDELSNQVQQLQNERDRIAQNLKNERDATQAAHQAKQSAEKDLSVALRMQMVREGDLKDLQDRFAALLEQKEDQDDLLRELTVRLDAAARYLEQIESLPDPTSAQQVETGRSKSSGKRKTRKTTNG